MSSGPLLASITDAILHLHGWAALAIVFALPALEASAFVGFIFPDELLETRIERRAARRSAGSGSARIRERG